MPEIEEQDKSRIRGKVIDTRIVGGVINVFFVSGYTPNNEGVGSSSEKLRGTADNYCIIYDKGFPEGTIRVGGEVLARGKQYSLMPYIFFAKEVELIKQKK